MYAFVLVVHIIVSLVLVIVILLQAGKGGGLADTFGGGSSATTIFGQKASVFLTRATSVSAVIFLCTSLLLAIISGRRAKSLMENVKIAPLAQTQAAQKQTQKEGQPVKTVRKVKIDPATGKEEVIEEKALPLTEEDKKVLEEKAEVPQQKQTPP